MILSPLSFRFRTRTRIFVLSVLLLPFLATAHFVSAHEVYVLTPAQIHEGITTPAFDEVAIALGDFHSFLYWAFIAILTVLIVFFASISQRLEKLCDPWLRKLKPTAPAIARVTVGISFIAGAYYQASYGPELPFVPAFGALAPFVTAVLVIIGGLIIWGRWVRVAATVALLLFAYACYRNGWYMLTYTNYLGEVLVLLLVGAHHGLKEGRHAANDLGRLMRKVGQKLAPYSFALLRVCFGVSLFYASVYAKIIHNDLALQVASLPLAGHSMGIAAQLGFEPHFLVTGAAIVEIVIALFFILGIEIRFTALFLEFWLSLSLFYFGESVWPHIVLIGIPIAFIFYGYDKYSLEGLFFSRGKREPIL